MCYLCAIFPHADDLGRRKIQKNDLFMNDRKILQRAVDLLVFRRKNISDKMKITAGFYHAVRMTQNIFCFRLGKYAERDGADNLVHGTNAILGKDLLNVLRKTAFEMNGAVCLIPSYGVAAYFQKCFV